MAPSKSPVTAMRIACETNDTEYALKALELTIPGGHNFRKEYVLRYGLHKAIRMNSKGMIRFLLDHGAEIDTISAGEFLPSTVSEDQGGASIDTLEFLVDNGWDINSWSSDNDTPHWPLLWHSWGSNDLIEWCLGHNARLDIFDERLLRKGYPVSPRTCQPLLDMVSRGVSIDQFKFFRERGAPLGFRMLYNAVSTARVCAPAAKDGEPKTSQMTAYLKSLDMVAFLLKIDASQVNKFSASLTESYTTPLSLVAQKGGGRDISQLVFMLLDAGGDVDAEEPEYEGKSAMWMANSSNNSAFLDALNVWRSRQST